MNSRILVTSGERLCAYLFESAIDDQFWSRFECKHLNVVTRPADYRAYFQEAVAINLTSRLIRHAENIGKSFDSEDPAFLQYLDQAIAHAGIEKLNGKGRLSRLTRDAFKQTTRNISNGLRRKMLNQAARQNECCYLCGITMSYNGDPGHRAVTLDHVWPRSFGGDSDEENLLPACSGCNSRKKLDFPSWAALNIHFTMLSIDPSDDELGSVPGPLRYAVHNLNVVRLASEKKFSLKRAYKNVGPWSPEIEVIETEEVGDFFNLKNY